MDTPFKELPKAARDAILDGTGDDEIRFVFERGRRKRYEFTRRFEGVIPNLERRYKETDSEWVREELERFMSVRACPTCKGARLKPEALAVRLHGKTITEVCGAVDRRGAPVLHHARAHRSRRRRSPSGSCARRASGSASCTTSASTT